MTINILKLEQRLLAQQQKYKDVVKKSQNKKTKPIKTINKLFDNILNLQYKIIDSNIKNDENKIKKSLNKIMKLDQKLNINKINPTKPKPENETIFIEAYLYRSKEDNKKTYRNHLLEYDSAGSKYVRVIDTKFYSKIETDNDGKKYLVRPLIYENNKLTEYTKLYLNDLREQIFYNQYDAQTQPYKNKNIIDDFVGVATHNDAQSKHTIKAVQSSDPFDGFKIINMSLQNNVYVEPNFMNQGYTKDEEEKGINCKYTKYIANLKADKFSDLIQLEYIDYLKENFRKNSCLLTAIINKFYNHFDARKADGKRKYKELTYKYLCEILNIPDKEEDNEVSLNRVVDKFFKKFNFAELYVYDPFMKLLFKHDAEEQRAKLVLRVMVCGSHIYILNDNLKKLEQQINYEDDERCKIKVGSKYNIIKDPYENNEFFCVDINEILNTIKDQIALSEEAEKKETQYIKIITCEIMDVVLDDIIKSGYIPRVSFHSFIYKLNITLNNFVICIECCDNNPVYGKLNTFTNLAEYKAYHKAYQQCYDNIIKKEYISEMHESAVTIEDTYKITPCCGYFNNYDNKPQHALDERKAYTQCLKSITKIPIFNYFDVYMPYNNEPIEKLTYYIIELLDIDNDTAILFNNKINRTYGFVLDGLNKGNIKYKILYQRKPLNIEEVDYKTTVEQLYNDDTIDTDNKKNIINKITGLLEQKYNKSALTKVFKDFNEANYYKIKYEGQLIPITIHANEELEVTEDDKKDGILSKFKTSSHISSYLVNIAAKQRLVNGLTPIKDMIYSLQRMKLYNTYLKMRRLNIEPLGIKTDCIYYASTFDKVVKKNFNLKNEIGNYKIETGKYMDNVQLKIYDNELIEIEDFSKVETKIFDDEKDTETINKYLDENKNVLVKGEYPGVGKSTLCKNYDNNSFFVLPYNKLCQNIRQEGHDAITYNKMFGLYKDDQILKNMKSYDLDEYETIVFDEAFLYTPDRLKRLSQLILKYPNKSFFSTGDTDQRNPIGFDNSEYLSHCMNIIFRKQVILKDIKRLVNKEDIQRWKDLKKDIFNKNMTVNEIVLKHKLNTVNKIQDVKTLRNIAYFNFRCNVVNNHINTNVLKNKETYKEGDTIVCRKYERSKGLLLNTNYEYKITSLKDKAKTATIKDEVDDIEYKINVGMLQTHFKLPYCLTCDSVQGLSFGEDEKVTIFDSNLPYTDRKFLWTAITRCRKLDNVYIYLHSDYEVEKFEDSKITQYFRFKVENYKVQDTKAKREINNEDYINQDWIFNQIEKYGTYCKFCNTNMTLYIDEENNVISNITVDRKDNKLAHIKSNCQLCCHHCNVSKK